MFPFYTPLKTSEHQGFSDVFRGYRKGILPWNGLCNQFFDADWNAPLKRHTKLIEMLGVMFEMLGIMLEMLGVMLEMLGIMLETPSISNQMCEKPILKFCIRNTWYFDRNSRFCIKILGFLFELIGFSFEITHLCYQNTKRETPSAYIHMSWDSLLLCT